MSIFQTVGLKPESPIEIYRKTLSRQKHLIQSNKYAQELETKYNKFRHKTHQNPSKSPKTPKNPHIWPIHSNVFTEVLRNKLSTVLKLSTPKAQTRLPTRYRYKSAMRSSAYGKKAESPLMKTSIPVTMIV